MGQSIDLGSREVNTAPSEQAGINRLLRVVADKQRRAVLRTLAAADGDVLDYETLTGRVVDRIRDDDAARSRSEQLGTVRISLYHTHLPKLADCGLIVNDSDGKQVRSAIDDRSRELFDSLESLE